MTRHRPNPIRASLLAEMHEFLALYRTTTGESAFNALNEAHRCNNEYMERSRGHGKSRSFIKSVAGKLGNCTYFPPEMRNGGKERARRV